MQCLFEEQTSLFHLVQHLSLLSLTVNVPNVGNPGGHQVFSRRWASGTPTTTLIYPRTKQQQQKKKNTSICIIAAAVLRNLELHLGLLKCLPFVTDNSWITAGSGVKQYSCHGFWFPLCYFLLSLVMLGSCSFQFSATPDTKQIIIFPSCCMCKHT